MNNSKYFSIKPNCRSIILLTYYSNNIGVYGKLKDGVFCIIKNIKVRKQLINILRIFQGSLKKKN